MCFEPLHCPMGYVQFVCIIVYSLIQILIFVESTRSLISPFVNNNIKLKYNQVKIQSLFKDQNFSLIDKNKSVVKRYDSSEYSQLGKILWVNDLYEDGFSVTVHHKCPKQGKNLRLIILVLSNPVNYFIRMSIRETWGQNVLKDVRVIFLIGAHTDYWIEKQLEEEQRVCNDIIRGNVLDSYSNSSLKTISALEWMSKYCSKAKFMLKTHEDVFVNVPELATFVKIHKNYKNTIFASFTQDDTILLSQDSYIVATLKGHVYLLTIDTIDKLFYQALKKY